jgi:hypothetical protein
MKTTSFTALTVQVLAASLQLANAVALPSPNLSVDINIDVDIDVAIGALIAGGQHGGTVYGCGDSVFSLIGIEAGVGIDIGISISLGGCPSDCGTYTVIQTQVVATGVEWGPWIPESGCNYCSLSEGTCGNSIDWCSTTSESFAAGFDVSIGNALLQIIIGNGDFNCGYQWGHSYTKSGSWGCDIPAGSVGRLFVQYQRGWADSQTRTVTIVKDCDGQTQITYGEWSASQRSYWALEGDDCVKHTCSTGKDAKCY